jgi:hypothetical protein
MSYAIPLGWLIFVQVSPKGMTLFLIDRPDQKKDHTPRVFFFAILACPACPVEPSLYVQPGLNEQSSSAAYLTGAS